MNNNQVNRVAQQLYRACLQGDLAHVQALLAQGADVNAANSQGNTPLHAAVLRVHDELIGYLLDHGAALNVINRAGITPLTGGILNYYGHRQQEFTPCRGGKYWQPYAYDRDRKRNQIIRMLNAGADPGLGTNRFSLFDIYDGVNEDSIGQEIDFVRTLLRAGLDPDKQDAAGKTLLHAFCDTRPAMLECALPVLLDHGADINKPDLRGDTPLFRNMSRYYGDISTARLFVENGADLERRNRVGQNALHVLCGCKYGLLHRWNVFPDTIRYLLSTGISPEEKDHNGHTPLHLLGRSLNKLGPRHTMSEEVKDLKLHLAAHEVFTLLGGQEPMQKKWTSRRQVLTRIAHMVKALVKDSEKSHADSLWKTCMKSINNKDTDSLARVLARHGDIMGGQSTTGTLMESVLPCGDNSDYLLTLLQAGYDIEGRNAIGSTPLHIAADYGDLRAISVLLNAGADAKQVNRDGSTLMAMLRDNFYMRRERKRENTQALQLLLAAGADPNLPDQYDQTPLHMVEHSAEATVLARAGADIENIDIEGRTRLHTLLERDSSDFTLDKQYADLAQTLIRLGCSPDTQDYLGHPPLHLMAVTPFATGPIMHHTINACLRAGADINSINAYGFTPLMATMACLHHDIDDLVEVLSGLGADPNIGVCSLHHVYARDVQSLCEEAPPQLRGEDPVMLDRLPFLGHTARRTRLARLVELGLDVNLAHPDSGDNLLHCLCRTGAPYKDMEYLMGCGADIHARNRDGDTPLMALLRHARNVTSGKLELLLDYDSDLHTQDRQGRCVKDLAMAIQDEGVRGIVINRLSDYGVVFSGSPYQPLASRGSARQ